MGNTKNKEIEHKSALIEVVVPLRKEHTAFKFYIPCKMVKHYKLKIGKFYKIIIDKGD